MGLDAAPQIARLVTAVFGTGRHFCLHNGELLIFRRWPRPRLCMVNNLERTSYSTAAIGKDYDVTIVGGGIVGAATARELALRHPTLRLAVLEKESTLSAHQSGHNSGVIHAGIYYKPDTLKAKLCVEGLKRMYRFCDENAIPYQKCGKLIVATHPEELNRLDDLYSRGLKNGVPDLRLVGLDQIKEIEPYCQGIKAIHSPHTGIVDYTAVCRAYGESFKSKGGTIYTNFEVAKFVATPSGEPGSQAGITHPVTVLDKTGARQVRTRYVVACAGLHADRVSQLAGGGRELRIVPFRGDYLLLKPAKRHQVRGNIYPVPDPRFPFLGFHFTPRMDGNIWLGPNAVLACKREGYGPLDFNARDFLDAVSYSGLRQLVGRNVSYVARELYYGLNLKSTVKQLQRFMPDLTTADVERGPSGVRAQALSPSGALVDDFVFDVGKGAVGGRTLHVRNAPSPAATSSLAIAEYIVNEVDKRFSL